MSLTYSLLIKALPSCGNILIPLVTQYKSTRPKSDINLCTSDDYYYFNIETYTPLKYLEEHSPQIQQIVRHVADNPHGCLLIEVDDNNAPISIINEHLCSTFNFNIYSSDIDDFTVTGFTYCRNHLIGGVT